MSSRDTADRSIPAGSRSNSITPLDDGTQSIDITFAKSPMAAELPVAG